jgi:putative transposase
MPRQARLVLPDVALHVRQRGHNRNACFWDETDRLVYLSLLYELAKETACAVHAYVLMTNHVHLLLTPRDADSCARLMRNLGQRYVQFVNRRYARSGTLWEGRYRSCLVDSAEYVLGCHRYIELNPVRAGMVASPSAYRWSSHNANSGSVRSTLLSTHCEYRALSEDEGRRHAAYRGLFDQGDDPQFLKAIREATNGGFPMLGEKLKAQLVAAGRQLEPRKPGPAPKDTQHDRDFFSGELQF